MDILLTLAVGQKYKRPEIRIKILETGGTLAAGLFLSGGLVRKAPQVRPMTNDQCDNRRQPGDRWIGRRGNPRYFRTWLRSLARCSCCLQRDCGNRKDRLENI